MDNFKKTNVKDMTAWDLNCRRYIDNSKKWRRKLRKQFRRKARRKLKENLKKDLTN